MGIEHIRENLGSALSLFAKAVESSTTVSAENKSNQYVDFVDELLSYFPMLAVNSQGGTYDQYLYDLRKTVIDNYDKGNYQVAYFYAHLIFMSYIYYSVEFAYKITPKRTKDHYDLLNAYSKTDKPNIANNSNIYSFSKIPEKEIFKVFYAIGMDVQYIQELSSYVKSRDDYAHATGKGNMDEEELKTNIDTIKRNMETVHNLFLPHVKSEYITFLIENCKSSYQEVIEAFSNFVIDENFSNQDIEYLCNLGISNVRNENERFKNNYRFARKIHCAFVEFCIENYGIEEPNSFKNLKNDTYIKFKYHDKASEFIENELNIYAYSCVKDGDEFPLYECPDCDEEQLVYDRETGKYHCFHCDADFSGEEISFCSECGKPMKNAESCICNECFNNKLSDE